jgi:tetratricopeptide (TPR) repeat protein
LTLRDCSVISSFAVARKQIKKELKHDDQFVSLGKRVATSFAAYAAARKRAFIIGATALVTVIVGSIVSSEMTERKAAHATEALDRVQKIASAELLTGDSTPPPAEGDTTPRFKTDKERLEAALKELDGSHAADSSSPLHAEAQLVRAGLLLDLDRADEARGLYEQLLTGGKLDNRLHFLAREGLGYAYERKGNLDQAATTFAKLGEDAASIEGFYKDRAGYHQARLAELRGNRPEAARLYHEVLDKNPTTSLRDEITGRLALLELK